MREWIKENRIILSLILVCYTVFIAWATLMINPTHTSQPPPAPVPSVVIETASFVHTSSDGSVVKITAQADMLDDIVLAYWTAKESIE